MLFFVRHLCVALGQIYCEDVSRCLSVQPPNSRNLHVVADDSRYGAIMITMSETMMMMMIMMMMMMQILTFLRGAATSAAAPVV